MFRRFIKGRSADDALVEIRPSCESERLARTRIPKPPSQNQPSAPQQVRQSAPVTDVPAEAIYFYGVDSELKLGNRTLRDPMIYATGASVGGIFGASLFDTTLPIAKPQSSFVESLPYWPTYFDCTPAQRYQYLRWLLKGRKDPSIELGYVFIFFYGLERHVVIDRADLIPVACELIRLLKIYDQSNSFRRYASSLLWLTLYLASREQPVPKNTIEEAMAVTHRWYDDQLGLCLAVMHASGTPMSVNLAMVVAEHDTRSSNSVIVRRHRDEFQRLFASLYKDAFGDGIKLDAAKRAKRVDYHPASGTLLRSIGSSKEYAIPSRVDVLGKTAQFKPLVAIWENAIEQLKAFSRANRKSGGEVTTEVYESLPAELQDGAHPEEEAWMNAWESHTDHDDWPIVPVSALASIKGVPRRDRLTKTQCARLLATSDCIGLGVEPDARITGKNYRWDERVTLFFLEKKDSDDPTNYIAASVLLRLGASIAEADGHVDESELTFINEHLQGQFNLSESESKRLDRLQYLILHSRSGDNSITKTLAKHLPLEQRKLVGEFLVGVAASDEIITSDELKALRKAYKSLELDVADMERLVARHEDSSETPDEGHPELRLDLQAVSAIMSETSQVATLLRDAMRDDEDEPIEPMSKEVDSPLAQRNTSSSPVEEPEPSPESEIDNEELDARYQPFLENVLRRSEWPSAELRSLADEHKLMLSGAIEAINEWSTDRYGDWLIEEGDTYQIHIQLIQE